LKPADAYSETIRNTVNSKFENTVRSRTNSRNTPIIVIGQAVHDNDLIGYLLEKEAEEWELLTLPAIGKDEDGNDVALWEHKHTLEELYKLRKNDEYTFATQYQQDPSPKEGLVYPKEDLQYFDIDRLRTEEADGVVMVGDIADQGEDSLSVPVGYQYGNKIYIVDVVFTTEPVEITTPIVAGFIDKHQPDRVQFESNNGGKIYAQNVNAMIKHRKRVSWKATVQNKHARILHQSGIIKENFYFRDDDKMSDQYKRFMRELTTYTKNGKVKHDDAPDAITMMAEFTKNRGGWR
jgi:predicted phage terminase large subunit-like protein